MRYNLGCGNNYLEGYTNVDFPEESQKITQDIKADLFDNLITMDMWRCTEIQCNVFSSFDYFDSFYLLYKWYFSLIPNGLLRITILNLEAMFNILNDSSTERTFKIIRSLYGSHESNWKYNLNGWTEKGLIYALEKIGFLIYKVKKRDDVENYRCVIEICSIKQGDRRRSDVIKSIHELFSLYKNDETDFEKDLEAYYIKQFDRRIEFFG
jgi:hypothetical protein